MAATFGFRGYLVHFIIFFTGASILVVEILATRILSPYFGNTIFTISSVIGVILAALSGGYYLGGRLADRYPSLSLFYFVIFLGGISILLVKVAVTLLMPVLGYRFSMLTGPLVTSLVLFFAPGFLLGFLSPFAIKIQHLRYPQRGVGYISGLIFFWSTLGSIFGCLLAGFVLIPSFGVNTILLSVGWCLFFIGAFGWATTRRRFSSIVSLSFVIVLLGAALSFFKEGWPSSVIYRDDGIYEKIAIVDQSSKGRPVRLLMQDLSSSGGIYLDTGEMFAEPTKYYALHKLFVPKVRRVLAIGGGAYIVPHAVLQELPEATVDVAEIEPQLIRLAQEYFGLPEDPRLTNHIEDGRRFLHDSREKYDLIFSDVYHSFASVPVHCLTKEFFELAHKKLNREGLFVGNFVGSLDQEASPHLFSLVKTFQSVFTNSYVFATESPDSKDPQNFILVGYNGERTVDLKGLYLSKRVDLSQFDLSESDILTDDYVPVEALLAPLIGKYDRTLRKKLLRIY